MGTILGLRVRYTVHIHGILLTWILSEVDRGNFHSREQMHAFSEDAYSDKCNLGIF
jgi:hypothetical protein